MPNPNPTRSDDETLLDMLSWRSEGHSSAEIGAHVGLSQTYVRTATNRVKAADIREAGDHAAEAYW